MATYSIRQSPVAGTMARKVPQITLLFWLLKLLTTAMGEATSDFMVLTYNHYLAVFVGLISFLIALTIQLKTKRYNAWAYWFCVSMIAVFGTMCADGLHIQLHVPYIASTTLFAVCLIVVFILWYRSEHNLSIHSIDSRRKELFYWATVLATFALGTAAGDFTATSLGLGYFSAGLMFAGIILVPAILYFGFKVSEVFTFWFAYIITRPLGASFADWTSKPQSIGGLNYGDGHVALWLSLAVVILVAYLSISKVDIKKSPSISVSTYDKRQNPAADR